MGPKTGAFANSHYDSSQLEALGANLALALLDYSDPALQSKAATDLAAAQQNPRKAAMVRSPESDMTTSLSDAAQEVSTAHAQPTAMHIQRHAASVMSMTPQAGTPATAMTLAQ